MDQKAYDEAMNALKNSELARLAGIDHDMVMRFLSVSDQAPTRVNVTVLNMSNDEMIARINGERGPA